jgi:two-component system sensor histidine kinase DctS
LRTPLFQPVATAKGEGHAGLGLSIVKNLAEALGGQVGYRPNPGGGAIFLVLLPQA